MSQLAVLLGFLIVLASIFLNAFMGQQAASIGIAFILIGCFMELRKLNKARP
jgi:hypothetical protein